MGMDGSGLSVADALALQRDGDNDGMIGGNGAWVFFLFFLLAWGGGFGGWGNRENGALTRAEMQQGFDTQNVERQLQGINNGLCDGFYAMNTGMLNGFSGVNNAIQQAQNATLINTIRPTPVPAYVTCSPYESNMYASGYYRNNGCCC